jgi:hypothetical protein
MNADPQGSWYRSARMKIDQKIVHGAEFKIKLHQEEKRIRRWEDELDKNAVCRRLYSTCTANTLPRRLFKGLETAE